jgi:plastocyanin
LHHFFLRALARASLLVLLGSPAIAGVIVVQANGTSFSPANITISEGDTVRWLRTDRLVHSITEGTDGAINGNEAFHGWVGPANGNVFEHTFDAAFVTANPRPGGVYDYFCEPHFWMGMAGTVRVVAAPGTPACFGDVTGGPCPCGNTGSTGAGCANSTGQGAKLSATGSNSAAAASLVLHGSQLVPNTPGLYFQGTLLANGGLGLLFGDGLLCASGTIQRLEVRTSSPQGTSQTTVNIVAEGSVSAGQTRFYQLWYRNTQGSPCGPQFNTTNAYQVIWQ